jgi:transposase-like protein
MAMNEIEELKNILQEFKSKNPPVKRYPKEFWVRIAALASQIGNKRVVREVGVSYGNLIKRIRSLKMNKPSPVVKTSSSVSFVKVPMKNSSKQITIELPHNISLRIDL